MKDERSNKESVEEFGLDLNNFLTPGELAYVDQLQAKIDSLDKELLDSLQDIEDSKKIQKNSYTKTTAMLSTPFFITIGALILNFGNHSFWGYIAGGLLGLSVAAITTIFVKIIESHNNQMKAIRKLSNGAENSTPKQVLIAGYLEVADELKPITKCVNDRGHHIKFELFEKDKKKTVIGYRK